MGRAQRGLARAALAAIIAVLGLSLSAVDHAGAWTFKKIHTFCTQPSCTDGYSPAGGLIRDSSDNLYGVTYGGGAYGHGVVFRFAAPVNGKRAFKVLYSFCATAGCPDGDGPDAQLILDVNGNLYGTTQGGNSGGGTAFELIKKTSGWKLKVLHRFCNNGCGDGADLHGSLSYQAAATGAPYDGVSPLYGTTYGGGANGKGTVFSLTPPPPGTTKWQEQVLYSFCGKSSCTDGANPFAAVLVDESGNLYGTTVYGGAGDFGTVFELIPPAPGAQTWTEDVIYRFCKSGCSDGYNPTGTLIMDASGNLLGTTPGGGANTAGGVVFKLTTGGKETVRYSFCALANCADGRGAYGSLLKIGSALYGTTFYGGTSTGNGTVFQLSGTTLTTLKIFCEKASCADGTYPDGDLITDGAGNIYGLTSSGGGGSGIAFELSP